ncbi:sulfurtransferase TusA family protein [Paenibacillus harenae]|uniref:TusA-related sulfurtransferase n=1 Tax=Paenibacillus harenae TaxID=306543 RepID=A0ABT9U8X0_PAEHA|nr:sulfurtransferase TusA family protein [Paenibacillus harenae]MDQ0115448.1 TusA-related sulfurtransferase [Paenibacillus harenae]
MKIDVHVDAKGLACPMPLVKAKKAIDAMQVGQLMELHSTDKGALDDFQAWVNKSNNEIVKVDTVSGIYTFVIRKG